MKTYFLPNEIILLTGGYLFLLLALISSFKNKYKLAVGLLSISAFCWYILAAVLDPFFHLWDERFHALVAKNMTHWPLTPMIYSKAPYQNYNYEDWPRTIIWLHKPPLFSWISALSFKLLGISTFTFRLPFALLLTAIIPVIYRMGRLLQSKATGFWAAFICLNSYWLFGLLSGRNMLDQNDVCFFILTTLALWCFIEYIAKMEEIEGNSKHLDKGYWPLLSGIFIGMAVLTKWLPGFTGIIPWLIYFVYTPHKNNFRPTLVKVIFSALLIATPWYLYTYIVFPDQFMEETLKAFRHLNEEIEYHKEFTFYYFNQNITLTHGWLIHLFFITAIYSYWKMKASNLLQKSLIATFIIVYIIFTVSLTKMPSFVFHVSAILWIGISYWIENILNKLKRKLKILAYTILGIIFYFNLNIEEIQNTYKRKDAETNLNKRLTEYTTIMQQINNVFLPNTLLFNLKGHYIEAMIWSDCIAYPEIPDSISIETLHRQGYKLATFDEPNGLPSYIRNNPKIIKIPVAIYRYY